MTCGSYKIIKFKSQKFHVIRLLKIKWYQWQTTNSYKCLECSMTTVFSNLQNWHLWLTKFITACEKYVEHSVKCNPLTALNLKKKLGMFQTWNISKSFKENEY